MIVISPWRVLVLAASVSLVVVGSAQAASPGFDGRIAFVRSAGIFSANADGSAVLQLTSVPGDSRPVWSPNGRRIAFLRGGDVWTMNRDGTLQTRVTTTSATEESPTWSPDGAWIAFTSDRLGFWLWNVYKLRSSAPYGQAIRLTSFASDPSQGDCPANFNPTWGSNGKIAFVHDQYYCDDFSSFPMLFTMNGDGTSRTSLNQVCACYGELDWAPNARSLLFVNYTISPDAANPFEFDGSDIYRRFAAGSLRNLSSDIPRWYYDTSPTFAPSGTRIVFQSTFANFTRQVPRGIWVMNIDGTNRSRVIFSGTQPNWGPTPR
jgi:Tol biopolymer transport system component